MEIFIDLANIFRFEADIGSLDNRTPILFRKGDNILRERSLFFHLQNVKLA